MTEKRRIRREGGRYRKKGCRKLCRWKEEVVLGRRKEHRKMKNSAQKYISSFILLSKILFKYILIKIDENVIYSNHRLVSSCLSTVSEKHSLHKNKLFEIQGIKSFMLCLCV